MSLTRRSGALLGETDVEGEPFRRVEGWCNCLVRTLFGFDLGMGADIDSEGIVGGGPMIPGEEILGRLVAEGSTFRFFLGGGRLTSPFSSGNSVDAKARFSEEPRTSPLVWVALALPLPFLSGPVLEEGEMAIERS